MASSSASSHLPCSGCASCKPKFFKDTPESSEQLNDLLKKLCDQLEVLTNIDLDLDGLAGLTTAVESLKTYLETSNANEEEIKTKLQDICDKVEALQQQITDQTTALQQNISDQTTALTTSLTELSDKLTQAVDCLIEIKAALADLQSLLDTQLTSINSKLDTVNSNLVGIQDILLSGELTVQPGDAWAELLRQSFLTNLPDLISALEGATFTVTGTVDVNITGIDQSVIDQFIASLETLLEGLVFDVNITNDTLSISVDSIDPAVLQQIQDLIESALGNVTVNVTLDPTSIQALVDALEAANLTVTIDTSAGPVQIEGTVTAVIDGAVQVEVTNFPTDIAINNWADLVSLLENSTGLNVTVDALPPIVIDDTQFNALIDAINNADKDDTDDDVRPDAPQCYCFTDPDTGELTYFFGTALYDEIGKLVSWTVMNGTAPPVGVDIQCADVKELQKINATLEQQKDLLASIDTTLKGELTVSPNALWEPLFQSAVTSAIENAQWPDLELGQATLDALENITVTVDTTNGPVEITGNVTATIDGTVQVEVTNFPTEISVNNYADLVSLLEASTGLNVTVDALPDVVIDATQFGSLIDAINNADKDDTDDDIRPGSPQCYCYTDPTTGDLVYFFGTGQYDEAGKFVGWEVTAGTAPPAGTDAQCADVKELQKQTALLESIDASLKGELTVAPNALWGSLFESAVKTAIETATWPELEVTLNGETINIAGTVALDQASLDALESITATIDAAQLQSLIDAISADVNLSAATIADLVTALEAANLTVTVDGGNLTVDGAVDISNFSDLVTALQGLNVVVSGTVDLGAATLAALENITVTIDTSAGPVEVTGNVTATIDGVVQTEVTNWPTEFAVNNFADLVSLLEASTNLNVTVDALPNVVIDTTQFSSLLNAIANSDKDDTDDDLPGVTPQCYSFVDGDGIVQDFFGYALLDEQGKFLEWRAVPDGTPVPTPEDKVWCSTSNQLATLETLLTDLKKCCGIEQRTLCIDRDGVLQQAVGIFQVLDTGTTLLRVETLDGIEIIDPKITTGCDCDTPAAVG